jgi:hypothetical protein
MTIDLQHHSKSFGQRLLDITAFGLAILVVKACLPLALETKPAQAAIEHFQIWRQSLYDPKPGSAVSLGMLTPVGVRKRADPTRRPGRVLLCIASGCGT